MNVSRIFLKGSNIIRKGKGGSWSGFGQGLLVARSRGKLVASALAGDSPVTPSRLVLGFSLCPEGSTEFLTKYPQCPAPLCGGDWEAFPGKPLLRVLKAFSLSDMRRALGEEGLSLRN